MKGTPNIDSLEGLYNFHQKKILALESLDESAQLVHPCFMLFHQFVQNFFRLLQNLCQLSIGIDTKNSIVRSLLQQMADSAENVVFSGINEFLVSDSSPVYDCGNENQEFFDQIGSEPSFTSAVMTIKTSCEALYSKRTLLQHS